MTTPESARTLAEDLLARASDDWVTAAEVIDLARRSGLEDPEDLRDLIERPSRLRGQTSHQPNPLRAISQHEHHPNLLAPVTGAEPGKEVFP